MARHQRQVVFLPEVGRLTHGLYAALRQLAHSTGALPPGWNLGANTVKFGLDIKALRHQLSSFPSPAPLAGLLGRGGVPFISGSAHDVRMQDPEPGAFERVRGLGQRGHEPFAELREGLHAPFAGLGGLRNAPEFALDMDAWHHSSLPSP
jgi:hypothetical protein